MGRRLFKLFTSVGQSALLYTTASFVLALVVIKLLIPADSVIKPRSGVLTIGELLTLVVMLTIPAMLGYWWMTRTLRHTYSRREARSAAVAFAVVSPLPLAIGLASGPIVGGYVGIFLGTDSRVMAFAGAALWIVAVITSIAFAASLPAVWLAQRSDNFLVNRSRTMIFVLAVWMLLSTRGFAQSVEVTRADFEIPEGRIIGMALNPNENIVYAQQYLDDGGRPESQYFLRVSSWEISSRRELVRVSFPESTFFLRFPCRRILVGEHSENVYTCSTRNSVLALDQRTLSVNKTFNPLSGGEIHDFAVDESRDRLYFLAEHTNGRMVLGAFSLSTGSIVKEVDLPDMSLGYTPLCFRAADDQLAVSFVTRTRFGTNGNVAFYNGWNLEFRSMTNHLPEFDGMLFLGSQLLVAPVPTAYRRHSCILGIDLQTANVEKAFCTSHTGIESALALVGRTYLVAGTGVNRTPFGDSPVRSISSSLSIWDIEADKMLENISLPPRLYGTLCWS